MNTERVARWLENYRIAEKYNDSYWLDDAAELLALIQPQEVVAWEVAKNGRPILPPPEVSKADAERRMRLLQERVHPPTGLSVVPLTYGGQDG